MVSVFGLGYVGTVLLGCLARAGHHVVGIDLDQDKLRLFRGGQSPILEEGIQELIEQAIHSGRAEFSDNAAYAINNSEISFICVGTPSMQNGSQDIRALERVAASLGEALQNTAAYHTFVIRSTALPGTVETKIIPIIEQHSHKQMGKDFGICYQPEFLREGSSIHDYYNSPFTIVGGDSPRSIGVVRELFGDLKAEFIETEIRTAEMVKMCCNTFHALKATFANEIGRICQTVGVDARQIMELLCKDTILNISPAYLKPGFAFGGSCLPKDLRALTYIAKTHDVQVPMISHVMSSNDAQINAAVQAILCRGIRSVGMIGLSFKKGTDDLRESPLVVLAERFIGKGLELMVYDPKVQLSQLIGANKRYIDASIPHIASLMCQESKELISKSRAVIIGHNDTAQINDLYERHRADQFVLDLVGTVDRARLRCEYQGACW
jgi:GDP-mannose 6-dehydrogenase